MCPRLLQVCKPLLPVTHVRQWTHRACVSDNSGIHRVRCKWAVTVVCVGQCMGLPVAMVDFPGCREDDQARRGHSRDSEEIQHKETLAQMLELQLRAAATVKVLQSDAAASLLHTKPTAIRRQYVTPTQPNHLLSASLIFLLVLLLLGSRYNTCSGCGEPKPSPAAADDKQLCFSCM